MARAMFRAAGVTFSQLGIFIVIINKYSMLRAGRIVEFIPDRRVLPLFGDGGGACMQLAIKVRTVVAAISAVACSVI